MLIDTNMIVPMTEANQNFSKVVRLVDESGMGVPLSDSATEIITTIWGLHIHDLLDISPDFF